jgi:hypothetical protein
MTDLTPPVTTLKAERLLNTVERAIHIFERLGGVDPQDRLLFKDILRHNLLCANSGSLPALLRTDRSESLGDDQ